MKGIRILLSASVCCVAVAFRSSLHARNEAERMDAELADASHQLPEESSPRIGDDSQGQDLKRSLFDFNTIFEQFKTGEVDLGGNTCTYDPEEFQSTLVAELFGRPELLTDNDLKLLQDSLVKTYTELANGLCDGEFRKMESAKFFVNELENTPGRYRDLQAGSKNGKPRRFSLKIFVLGNCRRCDQDTDLFDDAFRRLQETLDTSGTTIYRQQPLDLDRRPIDNPSLGKLIWNKSDFTCDCLEDGKLPKRPPGLDEVNSSFTRKVEALANSGSLTGVDKAFGVAQVKEVPCADSADDFQTEIVVNAEGDPDNVTQEELDIIKELFLTSYSTSAEGVCDSLFRVVVDAEVTIEKDERRRLPSLDTSSGRFRPFRFRFKVSGKCKGCEQDERLFDDAFRRALNLEDIHPSFMNTHHRELGYIFNGNECYCVTSAPDRSPYEDEFGDILNVNVQDAALPNIVKTEKVIQVDDSLASAMPSSAPTTLSPTASPTKFPTEFPTEYPTLSPSMTESNSPSTPFPSAEPSPSPSNPTVPTESPMPSPQPSVTPTTE